MPTDISFIRLRASAVTPGDDQSVREQLLRIIEPISGAVSIVSYDTVADGKGKLQSYQRGGETGLGHPKGPAPKLVWQIWTRYETFLSDPADRAGIEPASVRSCAQAPARRLRQS